MLPVLKGSRARAGEAESRKSTLDQVSGDLVNDLECQDDLAIITEARCHTRKHETITSGETACADVCRTTIHVQIWMIKEVGEFSPDLQLCCVAWQVEGLNQRRIQKEKTGLAEDIARKGVLERTVDGDLASEWRRICNAKPGGWIVNLINWEK